MFTKMNTWFCSSFTLAASAALSFAITGTALAQGLPSFTTEAVTSDINMPWGMTWLPDAKPAIWSYGHRNPQGIDINPVTGAGALRGSILEMLEICDNRVIRSMDLLTGEAAGRIRDIRQGPDGYIYLGIEGEGIKRLIPAN